MQSVITFCTTPVLTLLPTGLTAPGFSSWTVLWAEICIANVSEKNAVWVARTMIVFSPILSFHLTTSVLAQTPPLPIARCLAPNVWHEILRIYIFRRAVTTGFNLTRHPWEHKVSICLFPRTRRVVALGAGRRRLYIWLDFSKEKMNSSVMDYLGKVFLLYYVL